MEQLELSVGDLVFEARTDGPEGGELVLLLHGFPQTSFAWRHQIAALAAAGYRAVAPDQRGYSPRARPGDVASYGAEHYVEDVLGIADVLLGAGRFHLVGHDFGGFVAWDVASRHPERLSTLTVVSSPHPTPMAKSILEGGEQRDRSSYMLLFRSPEAEAFFLDGDAAGLRSIYEASGLTEFDEYVRVLTQPGAMTGALNWYRGLDRSTALEMRPITTPTLYVWSTNDVALGREAAEGTGEHVEGPYRFEVLDGVSHWIPEEAPDALNALLLEHLRSPS